MLVNERFSGSCYRAQTLASILAKSQWDAIPTFNQFVASFVNPFRQKMSEVLVMKEGKKPDKFLLPHGIPSNEEIMRIFIEGIP